MRCNQYFLQNTSPRQQIDFSARFEQKWNLFQQGAAGHDTLKLKGYEAVEALGKSYAEGFDLEVYPESRVLNPYRYIEGAASYWDAHFPKRFKKSCSVRESLDIKRTLKTSMAIKMVDVHNLEFFVDVLIFESISNNFLGPMPFLVYGKPSYAHMGLLQFFDFRAIGMARESLDFDGITSKHVLDLPAHDFIHMTFDQDTFSRSYPGVRRMIGIVLFLLDSGYFQHKVDKKDLVILSDNEFLGDVSLSFFKQLTSLRDQILDHQKEEFKEIILRFAALLLKDFDVARLQEMLLAK